MYDLLKAKLLIMPDWLQCALDAHNLTYSNIIDMGGLESILSQKDVLFYQKQVEDVIAVVSKSSPPFISPVQALFESTQVLHTNSLASISLGNQASGLNEYVKINALYGITHTGYNFFGGRNMLSYLPRQLGASLEPTVAVDPYVERAGADLYVLKFTLGFYQECPVQTFISNTLNLLMGDYGFNEVAKTKLFDYYTLMSDK